MVSVVCFIVLSKGIEPFMGYLQELPHDPNSCLEFSKHFMV